MGSRRRTCDFELPDLNNKFKSHLSALLKLADAGRSVFIRRLNGSIRFCKWKAVRMFSYPLGAGGITTRVLQSGLTGEPVVFVHGTGGRADRWVRNLDAVAHAGFRAFAFDLPGHGFATKSGTFDHSVPGYCTFLGNLLDELALERVTLVGTSLGGAVTARFAAHNPQRVARLVLVGSMGVTPIGAEACGRIAKGASNQTFEGVGERLRRVIFDPGLVTDDFVREEFQHNNSPGASESFKKLGDYIATQLDDDVVGADLAVLQSRLPILLVWGDKDATVPLSIGRNVRRTISGSHLAVIKDAAHTTYFEKPDLFNRLLLDFAADRLLSARSTLDQVELS